MHLSWSSFIELFYFILFITQFLLFHPKIQEVYNKNNKYKKTIHVSFHWEIFQQAD